MPEITSNGTKKRKLTTKSCERDAAIIDSPNETLPPKAPGRSSTSIAQAAQPIENALPGMDFVLAELSRLREQVAKLENGNTAGSKTKSGSPAVIDLTDDDDNTTIPVKLEHGLDTNVDLYNATPLRETVEDDRSSTLSAGEELESSSLPRQSTESTVEFLESIYTKESRISVIAQWGMAMPAVVRRFPSIDLQLPPQSNTAFSYHFLKNCLGGSSIANCWFESKGIGRALQVHLYALLNREFDPLVPRIPGTHGVQITPELHFSTIKRFPLFIRDSDHSGFQYYGTHKVMKSDFLGHNEMLEVPEHVKNYWESRLGNLPTCGLKSGPTVGILKKMWPKVPTGLWDASKKEMTSYTNERGNLEEGLEVLRRSITDEEAQNLSKDEILVAFERNDLDDNTGVSMYYEYLECIGCDVDLYQTLVTKMNEL
ncbi:uncharacterized protein EAE97_011290 [Botrytis byssoidea]|uniref:DUF6697 domain-containing protein n=1 Tax=Botrytis byssoidea TaxID=139641 RepID=A0A9P5HVA0_9HELO|nr:uncharacterized protein EAE97_011290 [Botrytis byssoidea]KAF7921501.1 hypothetical protein EAE97_011290 [Botrytis byssoidea]